MNQLKNITMDKREVDFELDFNIEATLVYYVVDYPEGRSIDLDWVYYRNGKDKHDMSFLLEDKNFYSSMQELANEDFEEPFYDE